MNLRERLEARSQRGTTIGSAALMSRIEAELGQRRWFSLSNPSLGFAAAAIATLVLVGGVLFALRPDQEPIPPVDTTTSTTAPATTNTSTPPESSTTTTTTQDTTTTTEPVDAALANRRFVWEFQPGVDDPEQLRAALETFDGYKYDLIRLVAEGDQATREVVFEHLSQPSGWGVQTLALMQDYGSPAGSLGQREPWPGDVKWAIFSALEEAAQATYGEQAELVVDLQRAMVAAELSRCVDDEAGCFWGEVWYAVPQLVANVTGEHDGLFFEGTMRIASDTGEGGDYPIRAMRTDRGWALLEGYPEGATFVSVSGPAHLVTASTDLGLSGYIDPDAELTRDGIDVSVDRNEGTWATAAWDSAPSPGTYVIVLEARRSDGSTATATVTVTYAPAATGQFAFIRGIDTTGSSPALIVDYAEFLTGEEAVQAAIEDGELPADQAEEGLPNDFYIRNQNPQLRTLPFGPAPSLYLFDYTRTGEFDYDRVSLEGLVGIIESGDDSPYYFSTSDYPVWLTVQGDLILQIAPQYLP